MGRMYIYIYIYKKIKSGQLVYQAILFPHDILALSTMPGNSGSSKDTLQMNDKATAYILLINLTYT